MHNKMLPECVDNKTKWDKDHDDIIAIKTDIIPMKLIGYGLITAIATIVVAIILRIIGAK
jgi:hypothetical protein